MVAIVPALYLVVRASFKRPLLLFLGLRIAISFFNGCNPCSWDLGTIAPLWCDHERELYHLRLVHGLTPEFDFGILRATLAANLSF